MTAITATTIEHSAPVERETQPDVMRGGIALSASLHVAVAAMVVFGLPSLFRQPPPLETPIAVQLVNIAPETRATQPNPYRPKPEAKPEPPVAAPAPKPEPKPEPPQPAPTPPPSAAAPPPPPEPPPPQPPQPEVKTAPAPPPPPPKPVVAQAPPPPPPPPEPKPRPKPEQHAAVPPPKPEPRKADPAAFNKLIKDLEDKQSEPAPFDSLMKNLTKQQVAQADDAPPTPRRMAAAAPPSSQPKAPLGSQLTASELDLVREQLRPCFNPPFGAKENPDLVADIKVAMNPDGTVQQARIVETGRYASDAVYRALADSGVRALKNPRCSPLRLPQEKYEQWKNFTFGVSTRDMQ